ncbi:MAG: hypothetical protein JXR97_01155 [Planctomycetes bacterium]|nr:hypothetical protein [Planctomycetota bacterium]
MNTSVIKNRYAVVAIIIIGLVTFVLFEKFNSVSTSTENRKGKQSPLPSYNMINTATILIKRDGLESKELLLTREQTRKLCDLFANSTADPDPMKWKHLFFVELINSNRNKFSLSIFDSNEMVGAYEFEGKYYRGGNNSQVKDFHKSIIDASYLTKDKIE